MSQFARYPSLIDRPVYITGGASGIGATLVRLFAEQGAKVAFCDLNAEAANTLAEECFSLETPDGVTVHKPRFAQLDLRNTSDLKANIEAAAEEMGGLAVLVNNAGHDDRHDWLDVTEEYWDDRFAVNLRHQFFAIQAAGPIMQKAGSGSIINMGSVSWMLKQDFFPAYATAKSAVQGLTTTMAHKLGPDNIRVNTVVPGWVFTERQIEKWWSPEGEAEHLAQQCIQRRLYPEEFARIVLWLAADDSSGATAQSFIIDLGGVGM